MTIAHAFGVHNKRDPRSQFQKVMDEADDPATVCFCPFGCSHEDQDAIGYCRHLIGFTNAPLKDGLVTNPQGHKVDDVLSVPDLIRHRRSVVRGASIPIEKGDVLVRITHSSRVYRKNPGEAPAIPVPGAPQLRNPVAVSPAQNPVHPDTPTDPVKNPPSSPPPTPVPVPPASPTPQVPEKSKTTPAPAG